MIEDREEMMARLIFHWPGRKVLAVAGVLFVTVALLCGIVSLAQRLSGQPPPITLPEALALALFLSVAGTGVTYLYCRFVKGPMTLSRLRNKGRTDAVEFCLKLRNDVGVPNPRPQDAARERAAGVGSLDRR